MEYDHSRKAGNRGDVWKHLVLVALADVIPVLSDTCYYVDCHAGAPEHELRPGGEWERGVGDAIQKVPSDCRYCEIASAWLRSNKYPAAWVFIVSILAKRFTRVHAALFDTADQVAGKYPPTSSLGIPSNVVVEFTHADGFAAAQRVCKADLIFIDPPFYPDAEADWKASTAVCQELAQRGLPFVVWYPFYWPTKPQHFVSATGCAAWEVSWTPRGSKPSQNLKGCGMLISNTLAPFFRGVETELRRVSRCVKWEFLVRNPSAL
jgi:23S rRNA A2030 N6-methylase RlmJ